MTNKIQFRLSTPDDLKHLADCLSRDDFHKGQTVEKDWQGQLITFFDEQGPIFHVLLEPADKTLLRIHIQFDPRQQRRNAYALKRGFEVVKRSAQKQGFKLIGFHSVSKPLIEFCKKHLGFVDAGLPDQYVFVV